MIPVRDRRELRLRPWATWGILALLVVVFGVQLMWPAATELLGLTPARLQGTGVLGLITHPLVHASVLHLLGNLLFLNVFGPGVEDVLGHGRFLALFVLAALGGGVAKVLVDTQSNLPMVGASSAISGVLAAAVVLGPSRKIVTWTPYLVVVQLVEVPTFAFVLVWLLLQLGLAYLSLSAVVAVAPFAHLGGFLAGIGLAYALLPRKSTA
ncbi:MAG: rhomboid family intramembrane serine protease [Myxococcota bacterium]